MSAPVVFWDFDGTLAQRPGMWSACLLECLAETSGPELVIGRDEIRPFLQTGFRWHHHDRGHEHLVDADAWWAELEPLLATALRGAGVATARAREAAQLVRLRFTEADKWVVFPGARACLRATARAGWRNAILSNHVPELDRLVTQLGLASDVDTVFSSSVVGWEKPHPEFFRRALRAMGEPPRRWMIGDNPVADIAGAEAVGIPALLVHTKSPHGTTLGLEQAVATILAGPARH
ncbi:HAD family hydrolase [Krasilnikovia sp. M28-CT-15]|uniref:HAD family hydrolase n=1 Tax=Krasilnikovia sp. M28-CT-15 TaxID=3373540 RepID=UPI003876B894